MIVAGKTRATIKLDWESINEETNEEQYAYITAEVDFEPESRATYACAGEPACLCISILEVDGDLEDEDEVIEYLRDNWTDYLD